MQSAPPAHIDAWMKFAGTVLVTLAAGFAAVRWLLWDKLCAGIAQKLKMERLDRLEARISVVEGDVARAQGAIEAVDGRLAHSLDQLAEAVREVATDLKPLRDDVQYMRGRMDEASEGAAKPPRRRRTD